jgi:hypothetical protein
MGYESIEKLNPERSLVLNALFLDKKDESLTPEQKDRKAILFKYWAFMDEVAEKAKLEIKNKGRRDKKSVAGEKEEAADLVEELLSRKIYPIVTVPAEFWAAIQSEGGLSEHKTSYLPDFKKIVGTLGVAPFKPEGRVVLEINCEPGDLEPRMTGKDTTYYGVVGYRKNFVPLDKIKVLQQ